MSIASDNSMTFNEQILQSAPPEAHPLFILIVGSTMTEVPLRLQGQPDPGQGAVPSRCVVVDALPYAHAVERLMQAGWTRDQVTDAMPRSHYFHLESPFSDNFRFDDPLNSDWRTTIFEPSLQRLAARPDSPGCAGTPALGRARVEGQERELRNFLEQHLHELIRVRPDTLALLPGVIVYVVTIYRGGTGTGASTLLAALLRAVMPDAQIHAHVVMPCVYGGDDRAYANAYAALRESQAFHRFNEGVPRRGGRLLKPPFDSFTPVFARNSTVALGPQHEYRSLQVLIALGHSRASASSPASGQSSEWLSVACHLGAVCPARCPNPLYSAGGSRGILFLHNQYPELCLPS